MKYDISALGNALVDTQYKVSHEFLSSVGLEADSMTLASAEEQAPIIEKLISMGAESVSDCGGSATNSLVAAANYGSKCHHVCRVADDEDGRNYLESLRSAGVDHIGVSSENSDMPTGKCLILVTPDSERTMCTFLGTAGKINENDVSSDAIKKSEIIFLEGYLWDEGEPKKAFDKAINNANKVAMSLSDLFCVDRHKPHFLNLVKNKLDITFANEQEITSLIEAKNFDEVINFSKQLNKLMIVTRGEKGAVAVNGDEVIESDVQKNLKIIDLTGAGDLFAAGFLHGYINKLSTKECLEKGTEMSSKVIQQIGARL